jgi:hypothetical protein
MTGQYNGLRQLHSGWAPKVSLVAKKKVRLKRNNINVIFFYKSGCRAIENIGN